MTTYAFRPSFYGYLAALWGLAGVSLLLGFAIARLSQIALDAMSLPWSIPQWALFIGFNIFMGYSEGYRGFQKAFSPRVAARALHLAHTPTLIRGLLAPLFCMGYFGATRRRKTVTWCLTVGIIGLVTIVRLFPQPWRGIIDSGVVLGLSWGLLSLWIFAWQALSSSTFNYDPELPQI